MEEDRLPLTRSLETEVRTGFAVPPISEGLSEAALVDALSRITTSARASPSCRRWPIKATMPSRQTLRLS